MESFIYLFITIVILVLSMRKKKMVQEPESHEEAHTGDPFRDIFRDDEDEEEFRHEEKEVVHPWMKEQAFKEDPSPKQEPNPWMTESEAKDMALDTDAIMREATENNPIAGSEGTTDDGAYEIGIGDDKGIAFDLKKAVIYSEIIERKVF